MFLLASFILYIAVRTLSFLFAAHADIESKKGHKNTTILLRLPILQAIIRFRLKAPQ